ncbi:MAG: S24/S26 family peptidase [Tenericutes bacterium]|nr:S24/S26 family peptidase [Mycoplasmatota bacterium]
MTEELNTVEEITPAEKIKKEKTSLKKTIKFVIGVLLIFVVGYLVLNYVPFIAKYDHYVIVTPSMDPVIAVRDIVIIDTSKTIEDMEVGEIIAFYVNDITGDGEKDLIVHYLYSVEDGVIKTISVNGDVDPWNLTEDDILGAHVGTVRKLGGFLLFASSTFGKVILLLDVVAVYLIFEFLFPTEKSKDKNTKNLEKTKESEKE